MPHPFTFVYSATVLAVLSAAGNALVAQDLRARLDDAHGALSDVWVYNDIGRAIEAARGENKPIFVTFRCVPCTACAGFDAEVAGESERIERLARERFVSVRQVEMKAVDLSIFQFDHDLNWAAVFVNADGVVYARYGTQSAAGPDAYNSIEGLVNTMNRVLELHAAYPGNKEALAGKQPRKRDFKTALDMPGLQNPEKLAGQTSRKNCIHCHNIHDAEQAHAQQAGTFTRDMLWRYPLPDQIGLAIDRDDGVRIKRILEDSPAAKAGLEAGEDVAAINGQPIASIADMQWALHHVPNRNAHVVVEGSKSGRHKLELTKGWKEYDISWRGSMWSLAPRLRVWTPPLDEKLRKQLNLPDDQLALLVKWINRGSPGGKSAFESGLREGDVIVAVDGKTQPLTPKTFNLHIKMNYAVGDDLPFTVLRNGQRRAVRVKLVE